MNHSVSKYVLFVGLEKLVTTAPLKWVVSEQKTKKKKNLHGAFFLFFFRLYKSHDCGRILVT